MSSLLPMALFGQEIPPGDVEIAASPNFPAAFRITMAAIDPSAEPEGDEGAPVRATLKIIRIIDDGEDSEDEDDDDFDAAQMERLLAEEDDDEDDEDDEDMNGGPSDPSRSKKAQVMAALEKLKEADGMELDGEVTKTNGVNGVKSHKAKGKMPASDEEDEDEDSEDDDEDGEEEVEEFVLCTLDPAKNYQQPLDITIGEDEQVFFKVSGTHSIFLTGNYVEPAGERSGMYDPDDDEDEDYDLEPDLDELENGDDEEDELDDLEDPRITELEEEDEAPKLVQAPKKSKAEAKAEKKANNKRAAEDDAEPQTLDEMITNEAAPLDGPKLSKKQLKKLKKNDGTAAAPALEEKAEGPSSAKSDKKVSFAKDLEQGPTPTKTPDKPAAAGADSKEKLKAGLGVKTVQGVTIDDKKLGTGPAAKSGDRVGMRYIGKLQKSSKVFDSNKKGKPFTFKLGAGEVIKGWDIGVQGMTIGGERRITIPANLAYGSKGAGGDIPPNSTLIFDVKLIEMNKSK